MDTQTTPLLDIESVDVDGAIRETADAASGTTRAQFLKRFAVGAGGAVAASSLLAPAASMAATREIGSSPTNDIKILNYALTLEYLEAAFYAEAVRKGALNSTNAYFAKVVAGHEAAHVKAVAATIRQLGGTPVKSPKFNFKGTTGSNNSFTATALALEETGVAAYLGQVAYIHSTAVTQAAGRIATVEARHAAWIRSILGKLPAPGVLDGVRTIPSTLKIVKGTGFIVG
ncbi:MAG: ferritin-like protein [Thermoleophilia bacterium]|nr:ferritin-like protein [Thermoleophilia bacterium]